MPEPHRLNTFGYLCPVPILLAVREMRALTPGECLEIVGDDPGLLEDLPIWCRRSGHRLLEIAEEDGAIRGLIEKGRERPAPPPRRPKKPLPKA
jgi:tRNA 2-thiouridine synthesizing protein A